MAIGNMEDNKELQKRKRFQSGRPQITNGQNRATKLVILLVITILLLTALTIRLIYIVLNVMMGKLSL